MLVTKLSLDCTAPMRTDTSALGPGKLGPFISWNVQPSVSSSHDRAHITIGQRKREFIPRSDRVIDSCYQVSKMMTNLLRHHPCSRMGNAARSFQEVPWVNEQLAYAGLDRLLEEKHQQDTVRVLPDSAR